MMRSPCRECTTNKLPKCIVGCKVIAAFQMELFDIPTAQYKSIAVSKRARMQP